MKTPCPTPFIKLYDKLEQYWNKQNTQKNVGTLLVLTYLFELFLIFLNKQHWLPDSISLYIHQSYFESLRIVFNLLLFFEVLTLIFVLPRSFSGSLLKQFEILSLILLRHAFDEIQFLNNPFITWDNIHENLYEMLANAFGALLIFGGILLIKRLQKHRNITKNNFARIRFICWKKFISILLVGVFIYLSIDDSIIFISGGQSFKFFRTFYTILIFADILMILISLRYSQSYLVLFRNSGFAFATVLLRIALTSPVYINVLIGIISVIFTLILTYVYNNQKLQNSI
jgi:hypothetical protein